MVKKARAKSSARHPKVPPLKLPLPWLVITVFPILLVLLTADFLPPSPKTVSSSSSKVKPTILTELSPGTSPLIFTLQKIEILPEDGDTLWSLAEELFGDGTKWTVLASENSLRNGRLTKGKTLTVSGEKLNPRAVLPEKLYRLNSGPALPTTILLPNLGTLIIPTEKTEVLTSPDGSLILTTVKIGNRTETYGAPMNIVVENTFFAELAGQSYTVYLYPDPSDPVATVLALFNLASL